MSYNHPTLLPANDNLTVVSASLQLKVRHKCGTAHAYLVSFDLDPAVAIEDQLSQDLKQLIALVQNFANHCKYVVNERTYYAAEIHNFDEPLSRLLSEKLPVIVLPGSPKVVESELPEEEALVESLKEANKRLEDEEVKVKEEPKLEPKKSKRLR